MLFLFFFAATQENKPFGSDFPATQGDDMDELLGLCSGRFTTQATQGTSQQITQTQGEESLTFRARMTQKQESVESTGTFILEKIEEEKEPDRLVDEEQH